MNLLTMLEIASNYPNGDILIMAFQHQRTKQWFSSMYLKRDDRIHKVLLSFEITETFKGFSTEKEAIDKMQEVAQMAIDYFKEPTPKKEESEIEILL